MIKFVKKCFLCVGLTILFSLQYVFATKELQLVFVGNYSSGKTALRAILTDNEFNFQRRVPTNHSDFFYYPLRYHEHNIMCKLTDTSGNKKAKNTIIIDRLDKAKIAVVIIDASTEAEQGYSDLIEQTLGEWIRSIRTVKPRAYILLAVTKIDSITNERRRDLGQRLNGLKAWHSRLDYVFTSAMRHVGINEFWEKVITIIDNERMFQNLDEWDTRIDINDEPSEGWCSIV